MVHSRKMKQPEGFKICGKENLVCKLNKSIYGLKQSPRCWNTTLDSHLKKIGFIQSKADPCIYHKAGGEAPIYMGVYVDDIVIAGKTDFQLHNVKESLSQKFELKDLGSLRYFLECQLHKTVTQDLL